MISQWRSFLEAKLDEWNLPANGHWNFLFVNNYGLLTSNIVLLWFHNEDKFPRVATKLCSEKRILKREFESLEQVHPCAPGLVPKPLDFGQQGGFWALWMEGAPGSSPLPQDYTPERLQLLTQTLASMHQAIRDQGKPLSPERFRRMVLDPLDTIARVGQAASVRKGCADLRARISAEWMDSLPVIPQHGDLFSGNLLSDGDRWHIVDWESFGTVDFPFYDLLTLLVSRLTTQGQTVERWDPVLVKHVPELVESYAAKLGLSPAAVSLLLPLTLANWCHLQWCDGRKPFVDRMYKTIQQYFESADQWQRVFIRS